MVRLGILALVFAASAAHGQVQQLVQPGASGEDVAPYSFLPTLARGQRDTNWAFTDSESGVEHSFRTFVRFAVPDAPSGHSLAYAYVWFYYAFDASGFGEADPLPATLTCHRVLADWSEDSMTWLNQPPLGPAFDTWDEIGSFQLVYCDATELVRAWQSGAAPNYGLAVANPTARTVGMHAFESTLAPSDDYKPSLLIGYEPASSFDSDGDGSVDSIDVCPLTADAAQSDQDDDGVGDACDVCPTAYDPAQEDADGDGIGDRCGFAAADLTSNGRVTRKDAKRFRRALGSSAGRKGFDIRCDLDADAAITATDRTLWEPIYRAHLGRRHR